MIGIVIVNFGDPKDTIELLQCFAGSSFLENFRVVIVDNRTNNENIIKLKQFIDSINWHGCLSLIMTEENLGFSGGNNLGIEKLLSNDSISHIWLLNNDTLVSPETLKNTLEYTKKYPCDILGATLIYAHSGLTQCLGGAKFNKWILKGSHVGQGLTMDQALYKDELEISREIDYISGASIIIPKNLFEDGILLDTRYFLFYEEMDLSMRFKNNSNLIWCKNIIVIHKEGRSINGELYSLSRSTIAEFHSVRSSILYSKKWYRNYQIIPILGRMVSKVVYNLINKNYKMISIDFSALRNALRYKDA